jgi:GNAT superfamily N-acetyltransferase
MNILIKEISQADVEEFSKEQWDIINRKYNFAPRETFLFGAYANNELAGYAKTELRGGIAETRDLLIKDNLTDHGIGTQLLNYVEGWAIRNKCKKSIIKTSSVWEKSVRFYEKNGYKKDATLPKYYYGVDWYYMSKDL